MTTKSKTISVLRWIVLCAAFILPLFMLTIFILRPDSFSAVTIWPVWFWLIGGLFGLLLFSSAISRRMRFVILGLWVVFGLVCCDEPVSLLRFRTLSDLKPEVRLDSGIVRVISLNCGGGSAEALNEVVEFQPDIVLAQESPSSEDVAKTAKRLYGNSGSYVYGVDSSVIFRGRGTIVMQDIRGSVVDVELEPGFNLRVGSVHLPTPSTRADLWSRDCWREYQDIWRDQSRLLKKYKAVLIASSSPKLIGGDFNLPARDGATRSLNPELRDAYPSSGSGLCNTIINDYPMHRIDQIWVSSDMQPQVMRVFKTKYSDHRMVVCDLSVELRKPHRK
jgi:endonuclease/exonuclease/phosphatase family metal-dependent hydrolase